MVSVRLFVLLAIIGATLGQLNSSLCSDNAFDPLLRATPVPVSAPAAASATPVADGMMSLEALLARLDLAELLSDLFKKHMVKSVAEEMAEIGVPLGARKLLHQALHPPAARDAAEATGGCVVCLERESVFMAKECGHKACARCVLVLTQCPLCRCVSKFIRVYTS